MGAEKRILIVDDEDRVLFILSTALRRLKNGFIVVTAKDGRNALEKAKRSPFDLLVTDLRMPGMDGIELTKAIRKIHPDIAVLWITAYGSHIVRAQCQELEIYRCLDKPLEIGDFRQIVREALAAVSDLNDKSEVNERIEVEEGA